MYFHISDLLNGKAHIYKIHSQTIKSRKIYLKAKMVRPGYSNLLTSFLGSEVFSASQAGLSATLFSSSFFCCSDFSLWVDALCSFSSCWDLWSTALSTSFSYKRTPKCAKYKSAFHQLSQIFKTVVYLTAQWSGKRTSQKLRYQTFNKGQFCVLSFLRTHCETGCSDLDN